MSRFAVSVADVQAAAGLLAGHARITPVMNSRTLDELTGARVALKCEQFQRTGAFKFRGAFNAISRLSAARRLQGVLAYSSGNHAQAVALVSRLLGIEATVVMPRNAPRVKRAATEGYGATVIDFDPAETTREAVARELEEARGLAVIPPYDHPDVVAGQGTAALELFGQAGPLDVLLVPCGGGGLLSGSALAASAQSTRCRVIGVEPALADDATRSFRTGRLHTVHNPPTIADGVRTPSLGRITFPLVREYVDDMCTVSETAIADAVRFLFERMNLVVEPAGALGVAALQSRAVTVSGRVGVILSGGNVDGATMAEILNAG